MCIRCQDVGIHSRNVLFIRSGLILQKKLENLLRTNKQTHRQRIQLQRQLLSPVDRRGERANNKRYHLTNFDFLLPYHIYLYYSHEINSFLTNYTSLVWVHLKSCGDSYVAILVANGQFYTLIEYLYCTNFWHNCIIIWCHRTK